MSKWHGGEGEGGENLLLKKLMLSRSTHRQSHREAIDMK
jgi:hypothetical protein